MASVNLVGFSGYPGGYGQDPLVAPCTEHAHCPEGYHCSGDGNCEAGQPAKPPSVAQILLVCGVVGAVAYLAFGS